MKYNECTKVLLKNKGVVMMRIAFISDIHGNAVALEAVLLAIELKIQQNMVRTFTFSP